MKIRTIFAIALLSISGSSWAQYVIGGMRYTCPVGASWDDPRCLRESVSEAISPTAPQVRWATRWGAIAVDNANAEMGAVTGMSSKRQAKKAALKQCSEKKGGKCQVELTYYNQCAVVVTADNGHNISGAATVEEASRMGMQTCINAGDTNCRVYYSACSPPVRIQ